MLAIFQQLGLGEILIILAVLLLLFGARKLPELARSMGRSTKEFKAGLREGAADPSEPASDTAEDSKTPEQTKTPE
ncbi:MAG: twin-arginine translocase TatA/TatE family subunit [Actinomycetota bacterium]